jgi:hypothetical protein
MRGQNSVFEIHQLPDVTDEKFAEVICKYGMKDTNNKMEGVPEVHFVLWNTDSEYYQKVLESLVNQAQEEKTKKLKEYLASRKKN